MFGGTHALLGYIVGWASIRSLRTESRGDGFLAAFLGAAPDLDYFSPLPFGDPLGHHGIAHSPLLLTLASLPFLWKGGRRSLPYYLALMSHVVADSVDNIVPLFSPFSWAQSGLNLSWASPWSASFLEVAIVCSFLILVPRVHDIFPMVIPDRYNGLASFAVILLVVPLPLLFVAVPQMLADAPSAVRVLAWVTSSVIVFVVILMNVRKVNGLVTGIIAPRE